MKKKLAGILAGVMAGSMLLSGTCMAAEDVTGEWYLTVMKMEGQEFNPADFGMEVTLTLNEDGTALLDAYGEVEEITWSETDGGLTLGMDGEDVEATIADGILTLAEGEGDEAQIMEFSREKPEGQEESPVRTDVTLEDFNGTWNLDAINMSGVRLPADMLGETTTQITINNGMITYYAQAESGEEGEDAESAALTFEGTFEEDILSVEASEETGYVSLKLRLHEDGTMSDGYKTPEEAEEETKEDAGTEADEAANTEEPDAEAEEDEAEFSLDDLYMIYVKAY